MLLIWYPCEKKKMKLEPYITSYSKINLRDHGPIKKSKSLWKEKIRFFND